MKKTLAILLCVLAAACSTGKDKKSSPPVDKAAAQEAKKLEKEQAKESKEKQPKEQQEQQHRNTVFASSSPAPAVTLSQDASTLGETVQRLSDEVGGSIVLMKGIEDRPIGPLNFKGTPFADFVSQLAAAGQCKVQVCSDYSFLYPDDRYAPLLETAVGTLDAAYSDKAAGLNFGAGTPLFEVFALLGSAMGITLVSDNIIGGQPCGALTLARLPLQEALGAVLKSARLAKDAFLIESTPEYIFVYAAQNVAPPTLLLNGDALNAEQNAALDKKVDMTLPKPESDPARRPRQLGAIRLSKALPEISEQLGIPVVAEEGMEAIPINPIVFTGVRVRTAMDLLVRQWPISEFGYRFDGSQIVIERKR